MANCISPYYKKETGISFPCGKCYPCKARRVSGWGFRLLKEAERSDSALFVTLTYRNEAIKLTKNNYMTLDKRDVQLFFKSLRNHTYRYPENNKIWDRKIKYYAVGEYGEKSRRPHYHLIIFNAEYHHIEAAWPHGDIHYGELSPASANYTLKYISKDASKKHANDDREPEFSLMSKRLGDNYLTDANKSWHRQRSHNKNWDTAAGIPETNPNTERFYISLNDKKIAMPRYYKQKIWTPFELQNIGKHFVDNALHEYQNLTLPQQLAYDKKIAQDAVYYAHINGETRQTKL